MLSSSRAEDNCVARLLVINSQQVTSSTYNLSGILA
jgi:hypothetical protein